MKITDEQFDAALYEIINEEPLASLITIPGVYEIVSEHFNNEAIKRAELHCREERKQKLLQSVQSIGKYGFVL